MNKETAICSSGKVLKVSIPCILNRASLGTAEYVYAVLRHLEGGVKVAWVPRQDLTVSEQPLLDEELRAWLEVPVKERSDSSYLVIVDNSGNKETYQIQRKWLRGVVEMDCEKARAMMTGIMPMSDIQRKEAWSVVSVCECPKCKQTRQAITECLQNENKGKKEGD